jgi:predicted glycosyltransferase
MPPNLLLYAHNSTGLGHLSRLLKIARALQAELQDLSVLVLTASSAVNLLRLPPRADHIKLPALSWEGKGVYTSKNLPLAFEQVVRLRERIILETALAYQPGLFLVDQRARGVGGELLSTLRTLRESQRQVPIVLGIRDFTDDAEVVRTVWQAEQVIPVLQDLYDEIWVYGCQALYDPIKEYELPDTVARKVRFCGYLDVEPPGASPEETRRELGVVGQTFVLVTVGGGRDGYPVLDLFLRALERFPKTLSISSLLVGGPDLPFGDEKVLRQRCEQMTHPQRPVRFMVSSPQFLDYMAAADLVVSMGGYNTLIEALALEKRVVAIPRADLNPEQFIRASLFERLGLIRMLHPDQLSPERTAEAIQAALDGPPPSRQRLLKVGLEMNGLDQVKAHVLRLLGERGLLPQPSR